jgi:uncharacterized protein (TIGR03435 family)
MLRFHDLEGALMASLGFRNTGADRNSVFTFGTPTVMVLALSLFHMPAGLAQNPARTVEAASIRQGVFSNNDYFLGFTSFGGICARGARPLAISGNRIRLTRVSLCQLVGFAYDVPDYRISGAPAWMLKVEQANYYDVELKAEGEEALTQEQAREILRTLLADRFRLKVHNGASSVPVYELAVSKRGSKLKEAPADSSGRGGVLIASYIAFISNYVDRPVVDATGLTARYQFQFDQTELRKQLAEGGKPAPSIFSEVEQQLGLTLRATNGSVGTIVIDGAERPTAN